MQKITKGCFLLVIILAAVSMMVACDDKGVSTSFTPVDHSSTISNVPEEPSSTSSTPSGPPSAPSGGRCDLIDVNLKDSRQSVRVNGNTVTMTVFAKSDLGSLYARLWYNARHENRIRPDFPVNEEFSFMLPGPGNYRIQVDVENDSNGQITQCDQLSFRVMIYPPENPECEEDVPNLVITGQPSVQTGETTVNVSRGTVGPTDVTFSPSLPLNIQRPSSGEDPGEWAFTASLVKTYGPDNKCVAETRREFSGEVPPMDPPEEECENAEELRDEFNRKKRRCENAGGDFSFELFDYPECRLETDCELPPPEPECEAPDIGTLLSWQGAGNPAAECAAFGDYVPAGDASPLFKICKAGNDREVVSLNYSSDKCPNGKDVSHFRSCVCAPD